MRLHSQRARIVIAILSVLILISMVLTGVVATVGASPAPDRTVRDQAVQPATASSSASEPDGPEFALRADVGDTTTTQPEDRRVFGKSLPHPDEGMAPQSAGDPGGWLQSSLFFIVCGAVILMALGVSYRARQLRERRRAAGRDPVELARARGEGVRAPSPLDRR